MAIGQKILGFLSGGFAEKGLGLISKVVKDKDQAEQLAHEFRALVNEQGHELALLTEQHDMERERMFNERTIAMEGTAKDLQAVPYVGAIIILLRGAFRPLFAYLVAYFDWLWFKAGMNFDEQQGALLLALNVIVMIFYFGERAAKNIIPVIAELFAAKNGV